MKKGSSKRRPEAASFAVKQPSADVVAAYNKLMAHAEIVSLGLVRSSASLHADRIGGEDLSVHVGRPQIRGGFSAETQTLNCGVLLSLKLVPEPVDGAGDAASVDATSVVDVDAEYAVAYRIPEGVEVSDDVIHLFASRNAVFSSWPFFRELAHSLVARMGMPPLVLPLFRMPSLPKAGIH